MLRRLTALGAAALVAGLVLFVGVFAAQERVRAQASIVTKTYTNSTPISIPDPELQRTRGQASPYPSPIAVTDLSRTTIRDVNVILRNYSHTFPDDVDVLLVGPARTGKDTRIMSDAGAGRDLSGVTLTLDDEALKPLPDGNGNDPDDGTSPIVSGSYKPSDYDELRRDEVTVKRTDDFPGVTTFSVDDPVALSAFDGTNPRGIWRLYVVDDGSDWKGQFAGGWSLRITARVP